MQPRMHMSTRSMFWFLVVVMTLGTSLTYADDNDVVVVNPDWSPRRLSRGEMESLPPMVNPLKAPDTSRVTPDPGPGPAPAGAKATDGIVSGDSRAFSSFGIPYATTRVQDGNQSAAGTTSANRLSTTYPYRTVGKLTFSAGYCSASVILRSVIVTAAHCIQNFGTGDNIFSNFQFYPGHYGAAGATAAQIAPYGIWDWVNLVRPGSWADGTDIGTGSARDNDLAVIALGQNDQGRFIGDITGSMSYGSPHSLHQCPIA